MLPLAQTWTGISNPGAPRSCCDAGHLQGVKPKEMHVSLVPFLEKNTSLFMKVGRLHAMPVHILLLETIIITTTDYH
jgi:hypothetical protein